MHARFPTTAQLFSYYVPEGDDPRIGDLILTLVSLPEASRGVRPANSTDLDEEDFPLTPTAKVATIVEVLDG